jgi:hypothetical protein
LVPRLGALISPLGSVPNESLQESVGKDHDEGKQKEN